MAVYMEQKRSKAKKSDVSAGVEKADVEVKVVPVGDVPAEVTNYPTIKRMLSTLDKFLIRRMAVIAICYMSAVLILGVGLAANGVASNASGEYGNKPVSGQLNNWLFALACTMTFLFALLVIRLVVVNVAKRKAHAAAAKNAPETKK